MTDSLNGWRGDPIIWSPKLKTEGRAFRYWSYGFKLVNGEWVKIEPPPIEKE